MTYSVKELFYTLQGEGAQSGRAAVFCRFAGCNLWSGLEKDRDKTVCPFCDTDFVGTDGEGGGKFKDAASLALAIKHTWPAETGQSVPGGLKPYVVFTGGEPLLQLDKELIFAVHEAGFEIGVETNGTLKAPDGIDWLCVSPKRLDDFKQCSGQELKLLYPREDLPPEAFTSLKFEHFFLQAVDEPGDRDNQSATVNYCLRHPQWRVSLQSHKILGLK
jgi:7-carboxy-7-deazaguanine synthase (Cx14CxxC type)